MKACSGPGTRIPGGARKVKGEKLIKGARFKSDAAELFKIKNIMKRQIMVLRNVKLKVKL